MRPPPDNLKDHFRKAAQRKTAKDGTISWGERIFEAPVALIGKQVTVLYLEEEHDRASAIEPSSA